MANNGDRDAILHDPSFFASVVVIRLQLAMLNEELYKEKTAGTHFSLLNMVGAQMLHLSITSILLN